MRIIQVTLVPNEMKRNSTFCGAIVTRLSAESRRATHHNMTVCQLSYGAGIGCLRTSTSSNRK